MFHTSKGFTLVETLVAVSILFISLAIVVPSFVLIQKERNELYTELTIIDSLRSELMHLDHQNTTFPAKFSGTMNEKELVYHLSTTNQFVKGCVTWENNHFNEKNFCLYKEIE